MQQPERRKVFERPELELSAEQPAESYELTGEPQKLPGPYRVRVVYPIFPPKGYPKLPASDDPYAPSTLSRYARSDQLEKAA